MLTDKQTKKVCLAYHGVHQCRYLETKGWQNCFCLRQLSAKKKERDAAAKKYIDDCKQKNIDPYQTYSNVALGDGAGCKGFPYLKHVPQGIGAKP